jgi:predicted glycosyltransferase
MKIWLDFCEPKSVTMLKPLYEKLANDHDVFITARDFDSTHYLLDRWGIDYIPIGKYGGGTLKLKLLAYSDRLSKLTKIIIKKEPDFLFCITSPEALRISFGLQIPNIMFNDEPRSYGPCSTTFPYVNQIIVPKPIPLEWYLSYGLKEEKIIRFNGIDEVGWLNPHDFKPNQKYIEALDLKKDRYVVCRTEPTKAGYLIKKMKPYETQLTEILPELLNQTEETKFLILTRNEEQFKFLKRFFNTYIKKDQIRIQRGLSNLAHVMYFAKAVISGGGTMVRESALLGVPSIEFFPLETYPQEQFLIDNGFPLLHIKETEQILSKANEFITKDFKIDTKEKINALENPIDIGMREFNKRTKG